MTTEHTELLEPGGCDKTLPANEVVEEFTFGQFVKLRYKASDGRLRPVAGQLAKGDSRALLPALGATALDGAVSIGALLDGKPEGLPARDDGPEPDHIRVKDVDDLIASGRVMVGDKEAAVVLDEGHVRRLLTGLPAITVAKVGRHMEPVVLEPSARGPVATRPLMRRHEVSDLAAFLAAPQVPGLGGGSFPLDIDAEDVKELRSEGLVTLGSGSKAVTVVVEGAAAPEAAIASYAARANGDTAIRSSDRSGIDELRRYQAQFMKPAELLPPQLPDAFTLGLYLPWTQSWQLKGYSRGSLAHSLTLAPQEEATIELFTWDRRKRSLEQSSSFDSDQSLEQTDTTKDVMDVVKELASSSEFKVEGHAKLNVKYMGVEAEVGVAGSYAAKVNATARRSVNHVQDSTEKAAARVRVSRQTRISESSETGSEERVTRKVRNTNMCRTLTLDYFEVLAHYNVTTAFDRDNAEVCVFVPLPLSLRNKVFAEQDLRVHERALVAALLDSRLADGFQAARTTYARTWAMQHVCDRPKCDHPRPPATSGPNDGGGTPRAALDAAVARVVSAARALRSASLGGITREVLIDGGSASAASVLEVQRWCFWALLEREYGTAHETLEGLAAAGTQIPMGPPGYPPFQIPTSPLKPRSRC